MADIGHARTLLVIGSRSNTFAPAKEEEKKTSKYGRCSWGNVGLGVKQRIIQAHQWDAL